MIEIRYPPPREKIVLIGLRTSDVEKELFEEDMQEMIQLCRTAGASIEQVLVQRRPRPEASTYIGSGKLEEIRSIMRQRGCRTLVIDAQLSPGQIRNIEKIIDGKVIDRSQLILDIFAQHARTNEARIQVELAQLNTLYPRLTRAWTHFSQQVGGIGTRGPGEKQLEVDRRLVQNKIHDLKLKLKRIERSRLTQRKSRRNMFTIALVGYTNVGKSSLLNALCNARALVENKLFATLDTTSRRAFIPDTGEVVISDTVGFIRKIPHQLVASFMSTLEVVSAADLLCIVLDASSRWIEYQLQTTIGVLEQLRADHIPQMLVMNKADIVDDLFVRKRLQITYPGSVLVSAFDGRDIETLKERLAGFISEFNRRKAMTDIVRQKSKAAEHVRPLPAGAACDMQ
jgi:GTP-binding protein HflX